MQDHIFRTYDIRGIVGQELYIEQVADVARAFAYYVYEQDPTVTTVAVGMDGRIHSPELKEEFVKGLRESGLSVIFVGVCPTPIVSFSEYWLSVQAACMITASHNPKEYNGIKLFLRKKAVFRDAIIKIRDLFLQRAKCVGMQKGLYYEQLLIPDYCDFLKKLFPHLVGCSLPIVFDCGNGAVGSVLPLLCKIFEFSHATLLYSDVDGNYPNHEADPSVKKNMLDLIDEVKRVNAVVGIAFDGDGDRMGAVTSSGCYVSGDQLIGVFSKSILKAVPGTTVVCDAKCSGALEEYVVMQGGRLVASPSGHAFLRSAMERENALLAGELSCHFFFKDRYFGYDDGVYAALRLIEFLVQESKSLDDFLKEFPLRESSPELRIPCAQGQGGQIVADVLVKARQLIGAKISTIDGVRVEIATGWGLLRASNTQPVICLRFEARSHEGLAACKILFMNLLKPWYDQSYLENVLRW